MYGGSLSITGGTFQGTDEASFGTFILPASAAIQIAAGQVEIGGRTTGIQAGQASPGSFAPPALQVDPNADVKLDPAVTLTSSGPNPILGNVILGPVPAVRGTVTPGLITVEVDAPPGRVWRLFGGAPAGPFPTPLGSVWLDPAAMFPIAAGVMGPAGTSTLQLPVPIGLGGIALTGQALTYGPGVQQVSTPTVVVLH